MNVHIHRTASADIAPLRQLFLSETKFQFVCNKFHDFGWSDNYVFMEGKTKIGYGSLWGKDDRSRRDTIFEFFLLPAYLKPASDIFEQFVRISSATQLDAQTNDRLFSGMCFEYGTDIQTEAILFEDISKTNLIAEGYQFRKRIPEDNAEDNESEYVIVDADNKVHASGGFVYNYNHPFIDIYMQVNEGSRRKGLGSYIVQELKREAYEMGKQPSARCNVINNVSKKTLTKAGFDVCGYRIGAKCRGSRKV